MVKIFFLISKWSFPCYKLCPVLELARKGLIFTRNQKDTQLGQLKQTGQIKQDIRYYVLSCSVLNGGAGWGEVNSGSGACGASGSESCSVHFRGLFCISFLSVLLLLLFNSFAVLLNCPCPDPRVLPFSFRSPPHPSMGTCDRVTTWSFVAGQGQTTTCSLPST